MDLFLLTLVFSFSPTGFDPFAAGTMLIGKVGELEWHPRLANAISRIRPKDNSCLNMAFQRLWSSNINWRLEDENWLYWYNCTAKRWLADHMHVILQPTGQQPAQWHPSIHNILGYASEVQNHTWWGVDNISITTRSTTCISATLSSSCTITTSTRVLFLYIKPLNVLMCVQN